MQSVSERPSCDSKDRSNKQGRYKVLRNQAFESIVKELRRAGINPIARGICHENDFRWIMFSSEKDLTRFLDIVARYEFFRDSIYQRVSCQTSGYKTKPTWRIESSL